MKTARIIFFTALIFFSAGLYAETKNDGAHLSQKSAAIPQWLKDVRNTEIITLGSLPFVTIGVTIGYSLVNVAQHNFNSAYFVNPFTKDGSFSKNEQMGIIITSSCICLGIGLTNLTINLIKRGIKKKRSRATLQENVRITEIENAAVIPAVPEKYRREKKYLYGNIESAVF